MADWGVEHSVDRDDVVIVEDKMMQGREIDMAIIGRMLRIWLPTGVNARFDLAMFLQDNGDLEGAYSGARGAALRVPNISFGDWLKGEGRGRSLELWAREYEIATANLISSLKEICIAVESEDDLLHHFGERLVLETRNEQQLRYPDRPSWWSPLTS